MNRREFLRRGGALTTIAGLAGCLGSASNGTFPEDDGTETSDPGRTTDENADGELSGVQSVYDEPVRTIPLGNRDGVPFPENNRPRTLRIWNAADAARDISFRIARDGEALLDRTVDFAADAYVTVVLNEPADYGVTVALADTSAGGDGTAKAQGNASEVSRRSFDCNSATTDVGVMPDGSVETVTMSTAMACFGPEVAETELSVGQGECGTEHRATVAFDGERVRVDGAVRTDTPRADLALAGATYDAEADLLTVRVRASESDDSDVGTQCVGEVPYETTVGFDHGLPGEVVVVHETTDETVEVTQAEQSR